MTTYLPGAVVRVVFTVPPDDDAPSVTITKPDGTTAHPAPTSLGDGAWEVLVSVDQHGAWLYSATIPGAVYGGSFVVDDPDGYATPANLEAWTGRPPPSDAGRLLRRATEVIAQATRTAVYATDNAGHATDVGVRKAFREACCAQVEFWLAGDEEDDILGPLQGASLGGMQQQYGAGANRATPEYLAPRAHRILGNAGLLSSSVVTSR